MRKFLMWRIKVVLHFKFWKDFLILGRIGSKMVVCLMEAHLLTPILEDAEDEEDGTERNAFVDAMVEAGEPVLMPFLDMCCIQRN
jgi:hypothetical protein